jgi:hypothetical protein
MDLYRNNKIIYIFLIIFITLIAGCGSTKTITKTTDNRKTLKEIVVKQYPYKLEKIKTLKMDSAGYIKPTIINLEFGKTMAEVNIIGKKASLTLKNKDTIVLSKTTIESNITDTNDVTVIENPSPKSPTFFGKIKKFINKIAYISLFLNIVFISLRLSRVFRY